MKVMTTKLADCVIIQPKIFSDCRGFFLETFNANRYEKDAGIKLKFVQDNRSHSTRGVLRGLHYQKTKPQGKLVTVLSGEVFDVAVDLRRDSPTFGKFEAVLLTGENKLQFYIPPGFAHGFCVISEQADFFYKCTDFYAPVDEGGLFWDDPEINIPWPISNPILSEKDKNNPTLSIVRNEIMSEGK
ncbi:TPA: dTDP-4-dehydrorhamnose 3,5-epimerase [Citrobacter farmeri]|uniref:dTDP-4-dehydrorhamnose 3,5-epimerase n=1 Tax=Citrobacter farmeri TaxID=67824 RepID=UPI00189E3E68|nr:dTDP-4-dehydrorhamnose 3,5-epimerase [Citrobacter farmeri]MDB2162789.1 dTDP-4-dehydrorhamnose 3,5-epimerase [Citrobacter farmeri]HBC0357706.1 dTDP-4-dehydrorhamnose 3,5-epimerase [Citrobacter farmeri]HBZ8835902.1 dTDP-4-dehydrorhamnose 3,5-epimerase [Citrobacter farmeri]HBZ9183157.1 dTDP-4-dehydrorhamnose 3,5-epimerase [Citrobacter farmeri]HBZ9438113.1 dTDP-4-dehydrorhamnose 3,5-epimerase [Citrobacter farmeri]